MALKQPLTADYSPQSKILKIWDASGTEKLPNIELPVDDPNVFIGWISAVLFEKYKQPGGGGKAIAADAISISGHINGAGRSEVVFGFKAGDMQLSFILPVQTQIPERLASIKAHLDQAIAEMTATDTPTKQ